MGSRRRLPGGHWGPGRARQGRARHGTAGQGLPGHSCYNVKSTFKSSFSFVLVDLASGMAKIYDGIGHLLL